jgi:ADP-ribose pyrophosphatase YjhB (NUDIX family)
MFPVRTRWARFGETDRRWFTHLPQGAFCVSAFLIVTNRTGDVLLGQPREHPDWPEKGCVPTWRVREFIREGCWILPASHFRMYEAPRAAAARVARTWAGIPRADVRLVDVTSELFPTGRYRRSGHSRQRLYHWAVCFVFQTRADRISRVPPGWKELRFFSSNEIRATPVGRGHGDIIRAWRSATARGRRR